MAIPPLLDPAVPDLVSPRLLLRKPRLSDAGPIQALADDWEVARWMARLPHPYRRADATFFLDQIVPKEACWAITERATGHLAGVVGLAPIASPDGAEFGYWLGRHHWGCGLATEAGRAVIRHAFETTGLADLRSGCFVGNERSAHVLEKLGFRVTGHSQRTNLARGEKAAHVDMLLMRRDWRPDHP